MIGCWFSSMRLWISIECAYCVAIMLISLKVLLIFMTESLCMASSLFIDGMYVVALALATNTMSGATFHSLAMMLLMSGWYFVDFATNKTIIGHPQPYMCEILHTWIYSTKLLTTCM